METKYSLAALIQMTTFDTQILTQSIAMEDFNTDPQMQTAMNMARGMMATGQVSESEIADMAAKVLDFKRLSAESCDKVLDLLEEALAVNAPFTATTQ